MCWGLGVGRVWFDWDQAPGGLAVGQLLASPHKIYRIHHTGMYRIAKDTENAQHRWGTRLNFWICDTRRSEAKRHEQGSWAGGPTVFGIFLVEDWSAAQRLRRIAQESNQLSGNARSTEFAWWRRSWASSAFNNDAISGSLESNRLLVEIKNSNPSLLYILSPLLNVVVPKKRISGSKNFPWVKTFWRQNFLWVKTFCE